MGVETDRAIYSISKEEFEPKDWEPEKTGLDIYSSGVEREADWQEPQG